MDAERSNERSALVLLALLRLTPAESWAEAANPMLGTRAIMDVIRDEYIDMVKGGVIDPAKVTRGALENAASIAAMILTTEALITDVPVKESAPAQPPMPEY